MNISILDCTLRDGGYINKWIFGKSNLLRIIDNLEKANIDIIECGFLRDEAYNENKSVFCDVKQITQVISPKKVGTMYVAMIAVGDISSDKIAPCDSQSIDGIRLTFHKNEWNDVKALAIDLKNKGYKVFVQPVGTTNYTDAELLSLIQQVNELQPFAFYIVDTLGTMYENYLLRNFYLLDNNLNPEIVVGYHSHNNLQMAFSNSQALMRVKTKRDIIIDASIFGMGRAAGNLCTELITQYINVNVAPIYDVRPLVEIVDECLLSIYAQSPWGYSVPYFLSAGAQMHPDYSTYLLNKQKIDIQSIGAILNQVPINQRHEFNQECIEELYLRFQTRQIDDMQSMAKIKELLNNKSVILIAPGKSIETHKETVKSFIKERQPFVISVNFVPNQYNTDLVFVSNMKRFHSIDQLNKEIDCDIIVTSNITQTISSSKFILVNYTSLLQYEIEADNAGIMLLSLLEKLNLKDVYLAGFDGFSFQSNDNYIISEMDGNLDRMAIIQKNESVDKQLRLIQKKINLHFITPTLYLK